MKRRIAVYVVALLMTTACVSKPAPWKPDGRGAEINGEVGRVSDSAGQTDSVGQTDITGDSLMPPTDNHNVSADAVDAAVGMEVMGDSLQLDMADASQSQHSEWETVLDDLGKSSPMAVLDSYTGDVYVVGYVDPSDASKNKGFVVRLDKETGTPIWTEVHDSNKQEWFTDVVENPLGNLFAGTLNSGYVKVSSTGYISGFGGLDDDLLNINWNTIAWTSNGELLLTGYEKQSTATQDYAGKLCRVTQEGDKLWCKEYGPKGQYTHQRLSATVELPSGDFLSVGRTTETQAGEDVWVAGVSASGALVWDKTLPGEPGEQEALLDALLISGGVLAVGKAGEPEGENGQSNVLVMRLTFAGDIVWQKQIEREGPQAGLELVGLGDDGAIVLSTVKDDDGNRYGTLHHVSFDGEVVGEHSVMSGKDLYVDDVKVGTDGSLILCGRHNLTDDSDKQRAWIRKMAMPF